MSYKDNKSTMFFFEIIIRCALLNNIILRKNVLLIAIAINVTF